MRDTLTLQNYLLGDAIPAKWWAMMILSCAMAAVMMFNRVKKRDIKSERTPEQWDWKWFIGDSIGRICSTVLSIFLLTRVLLVYIKPQYVIVYSIIVGMISDQLPVIFGFAKKQAVTKIKVIIIKYFGKEKTNKTKSDES